MFKRLLFCGVVVCLTIYLINGKPSNSLLPQWLGEQNQDLLEYTNVVLYMATNYIGPKTNTLVIMETCVVSCDQHQLYHTTVLKYFINNLQYSLAIQLFFGYQDEKPWDYNMLLVSSYWDFETLRFRIPSTKHERQFYFFIIFTSFFDDQEDYEGDIYGIFDLCNFFKIRNVVIMNRPLNQTYISFFTYRIDSSKICGEKFTIEEINRYENGYLQRPFLFPNHQTNFHGCSLIICCHIIPPFLTFNGDVHNDGHLKDVKRLGGIEGEILKLVAQTLNLKLVLRFTPDVYNKEDGSRNTTGCLNDVAENLAQMAIGGLSAFIPLSEKFSVSYAHHTSPYVFIIRGSRFFGPIQQLFFPLEPTAWWAIGFQLVIIIVALEIVLNFVKPTWRDFILGSRNKYPIRNLFVTLIGNTLPNSVIPRRNFARFLLMAWLLWCFELRNFYQGKLFDSLRLIKRQPSPKTIGELIENDYTLLAFRRSRFYPENKTKIIHHISNRLDMINESEERLTATAMLDYLAYYNMMHWNISSLTHVKEVIYLYQCVMVFPKYSIFLSSFNTKFKFLSSAGITAYKARQHVHPFFYNTNFHIHSDKVSGISQKNLIGLYYNYVIMSTISIFFFILELLSSRCKKVKIFLDYFH
ncbi:uncharacterized protein LOC142240114 [Haematobia irritans]|uniref:uncharacterized protein LOC142240114 n=1 Tax=Haematobia irritans TaxID=7368 RepID=UPI003F504EBC